MSYYRRKSTNGWAIALYILLAILFIGAVFCLVVLIASTANNIGFVEQLQQWFGSAKEVVDSTPAEDVPTTVECLKNMIRF